MLSITLLESYNIICMDFNTVLNVQKVLYNYHSINIIHTIKNGRDFFGHTGVIIHNIICMDVSTVLNVQKVPIQLP